MFKLKLNYYLIAFVVDYRDILRFEVKWTRLVGCDIDDAEVALLEHTVEGAIALAKGQCLGGIVVGDIDGSELTFLIIIVGALVLIELELTIAAGIDIQRDVVCRALVAILHLRTIRNDAAFADIDGDALIRSIDYKPTA